MTSGLSELAVTSVVLLLRSVRRHLSLHPLTAALLSWVMLAGASPFAVVSAQNPAIDWSWAAPDTATFQRWPSDRPERITLLVPRGALGDTCLNIAHPAIEQAFEAIGRRKPLVEVAYLGEASVGANTDVVLGIGQGVGEIFKELLQRARGRSLSDRSIELDVYDESHIHVAQGSRNYFANRGGVRLQYVGTLEGHLLTSLLSGSGWAAVCEMLFVDGLHRGLGGLSGLPESVGKDPRVRAEVRIAFLRTLYAFPAGAESVTGRQLRGSLERQHPQQLKGR
jgi:hypothetical protein